MRGFIFPWQLHPRDLPTHVPVLCRGAGGATLHQTVLPAGPKHLVLRMQEVWASETASLGGFFAAKQQKQEDPSLRCPELLPRWAPQCGGVWGGVPTRRGVPSGMCVCALASRQPGSINLGVEAFPAHINSQQKLTPTRTAFIPTNYICCGAAIKHSYKSSVMRNLHSSHPAVPPVPILVPVPAPPYPELPSSPGLGQDGCC